MWHGWYVYVETQDTLLAYVPGYTGQRNFHPSKKLPHSSMPLRLIVHWHRRGSLSAGLSSTLFETSQEIPRGMAHNDESTTEKADDNRGEEESGDQTKQLQMELWEEERLLLEELIHCRVVNKRIREDNLVSARLTQILTEIERDRALEELEEARNHLQSRIQNFHTSTLDSMFHRQRELLRLIQQGSGAALSRPEFLVSLDQSQIASVGLWEPPLAVGSVSSPQSRAKESRSLSTSSTTRGTLPISHGLEDAVAQNSRPAAPAAFNESSGRKASTFASSSGPSDAMSEAAKKGAGKYPSNPPTQSLRRSPRHKRPTVPEDINNLDRKPAAAAAKKLDAGEISTRKA